MKVAVVFLVLASVFAVVFSATKFTTKYDNVPLDEILSNERLSKNYFDCLMDKKKCTPDGQELKDAMPTALKEDCAGCSEKQKIGAEKVIAYLADKKPEQWKELQKKYDPEGKYAAKHVKLADKHGIKL